MPRTDCLVKVTGMRPFRAKKYFCDDHPNAAKWLRISPCSFVYPILHILSHGFR